MIKQCIRCGENFDAYRKQILCTPCKTSDGYNTWANKYYKVKDSIVSNVDVADMWKDNIATISCRHCGVSFTHNAIKYDSKTVIPIYCEEHRNLYKRGLGNTKSKKDVSVDYEKLLELGEALSNVPKAIKIMYGNKNDIDIRIFSDLYDYIIKTRGYKYFRR